MNRHSPPALLLACLLLLTGCGASGDDPKPTAVPTPTTVPTLPAGAISVGQLMDQIDAAWGGVTSMRATSWTVAGQVSSTPPTTGQVTVEETVLPSSRQVTQLADGTPTDQALAIDGRVYMKGAMVPAAVAPMMDTTTWVEIDPRTADSSSPLAPQVAYLLSPIGSPFAATLAETRSQQATPAGAVNVESRACTSYTFGNVTGDGIAYQIAIDEQGLPCMFVQSAGGHANVTVYAFNVEGLVLAAPAVATPAAP